MNASDLNDREFAQFQSMLYDIAGISLTAAKKPLVAGRLAKRLREYQLNNFSQYLALLAQKEYRHEVQTAIDLLTTNETYFFREPNHFAFLKRQLAVQSRGAGSFRVWSAACSSGQEPYSIAMVLQECLAGRNWEVLASDISTRVLDTARAGVYPIAQADNIERPYLTRYCLKGVGSQAGSFMIDKMLRDKLQFFHCNLNARLPDLGLFDIIFLRNVMIYFDVETKRQVVNRLQAVLKPGGFLFIGHSESLQGINRELKMIVPAVFQKPIA